MQIQKVGDAGGRAGWLSSGAESLSPSGGLRCRSAETQRGRNLDLHCSIIPKVVVLGLGVIEGGTLAVGFCLRMRPSAYWTKQVAQGSRRYRSAHQIEAPGPTCSTTQHPGGSVQPRCRAECAVGSPVAVNSRHLCTTCPATRGSSRREGGRSHLPPFPMELYFSNGVKR